jgi:hypothetical protein
MPINVAFGLAAGFLYSFFYDRTGAIEASYYGAFYAVLFSNFFLCTFLTVTKYRGASAVGLVSAIGSASCALAAFPISSVAQQYGKVRKFHSRSRVNLCT